MSSALLKLPSFVATITVARCGPSLEGAYFWYLTILSDVECYVKTISDVEYYISIGVLRQDLNQRTIRGRSGTRDFVGHSSIAASIQRDALAESGLQHIHRLRPKVIWCLLCLLKHPMLYCIAPESRRAPWPRSWDSLG